MNLVRGVQSGDGAGGLSPQLVREECERVLASPSFGQSPTLARLLRYLVDETLNGHDERLKEYSVGLEVFGRGPSFDPRIDTIVRAHARRLRQRLADYYRNGAEAGRIVLELPRGHYVIRARLATDADCREAASATLDSIVVLPFASYGDESDESFTDGLTEEIITALSAVPSLHVVARTSAFQFKGVGRDIREIGRVLGVGTALEGSVTRSGQAVRVNMRLIDARDGFQIWSLAADFDISGTFRAQDELSRSVVEALRARFALAAAVPRMLAPRSADAHDSFLKGRYFWNKATPESIGKAIRHLQDAIARDPGYASAHAALADAFVFLATLEAESPAPLFEEARRAATRALELQDVAEAHSAIGSVLGVGDWAWHAAEREFAIAVALAPSSSHVRGAFAMCCLAPQRRFDEAIDQLRHAVRLDPLSTFQRAMLGQVLLLSRRHTEAMEEIEHALDLDATHLAASLAHAWALIALGDFEAAIAVLRAMPPEAADVPNHASHLGHALACAGYRAEAESVLRQLLGRFSGPWVPGVDVAAIYCGLGEHDTALSFLERARTLRSFDLVFVEDDPRFATMSGDIRLRQLVASCRRPQEPPSAPDTSQIG
jgi:serine/threonine-protein kinase